MTKTPSEVSLHGQLEKLKMTTKKLVCLRTDYGELDSDITKLPSHKGGMDDLKKCSKLSMQKLFINQTDTQSFCPVSEAPLRY